MTGQPTLDGMEAVLSERELMAEWARTASLDTMIDYSRELLYRVQAEHRATHHLTGTLGLFSGGNDSTTFMHLLRGSFDKAVHVNTGIGIVETRQYVRDTCEAWDLPLIVGHPPKGCTYRDVVLKYGFPGPALHGVVYRYIKERALREVRRTYVTRPRQERVLFVAGMRYFESRKRMTTTEETHRDGSTVWCSPIMWWTDEHMAEYRSRFDVPRNEVSDHMHMSGECMCGANAKPGELNQVRFFYPPLSAEIEALQVEAKAAQVHCVWGTRPPPSDPCGPTWVCPHPDQHDDAWACDGGTWATPGRRDDPDDAELGPMCAKCDRLDLGDLHAAA